MAPRTKSPVAASAGPSPSPSPRRSARFAPIPAPVASTSRIPQDGATTPRFSRRLSLKAATTSPPGHAAAAASPSPTHKKRKSPDLQDSVRKRQRARCPAEPHPTPTRTGKGKAPSPPSDTDKIGANTSRNGLHNQNQNPQLHARTSNSENQNTHAPATQPFPVRRVTRRTAHLFTNGHQPSLKPPSTSSSPSPSQNLLTLRPALRGTSPAPNTRLDEIDMGVASPLTSPVRERSDAPWAKEEAKVKEEPVEDRMDAEGCEDASSRREENGENGGGDGKEGKAQGADAEGDVEMPPASLKADAPMASAEPSASAATNAKPSPSTTSSPGAPSNTGNIMPPRSLSPEDFSPSPFAPCVLPVPTCEPSPLVAPPADATPPSPFATGNRCIMTARGVPDFAGPDGLPITLDMSAAGPPVSPDWPLPHAPFPLSPSPTSPTGATASPTSPYGYPGVYGTGAGVGYAERHTRAVEWNALVLRRQRAGELAAREAAEAAARAEAVARWRGWMPPGRGAAVPWPADAGAGPEAARRDVEMEPQEEEMSSAGDAATDEAYDGATNQSFTGRGMRGRSPLSLVSPPFRPLSATPPAENVVVLEPSQQLPQSDAGRQEQGPSTDLVYEAPPQLGSPYPQHPQEEIEDLGPDPHTRLHTSWGLWKIASRVRVWDIRTRYTPALIRSLVAQEADDFYSSTGKPHPDALHFMDEEYYDWELEDSASEGDGSGEDDGDGDSFELEPPLQQSFSLNADSNNPSGEDSIGTAEMDVGGALSSFYVAPQQQPQPTGPAQGPGFPPQLQLPLPLPPPPLASVRVPVLRHLFTDIPIAPAGGAGGAGGRGTPVDTTRRAAWRGTATAEELEDGGHAGAGRGTLERRLPHPRSRPHPLYLAMARAAEAEGGNAFVQGPEGLTQDLARQPGDPPVLPIGGLKDLVRSMRVEDEEGRGTEEGRGRQEMSEPFEPDEAVWQEFLKSVGVDGTAGSTSASSPVTAQIDGDAMEVDAHIGGTDGDADADAEADSSSGGAGGTSGGVSLGLPPAGGLSIPPSANSAGASMLGPGMGVEMGIGMFGMAMGAMGMGWFGGASSPPVAVSVGDGGERERERESSLSFALGV
ncbi:hypothetical protein GGX14DRAFT_467448 [Mycena pura]|uniref:Uncharacterized protein n=1 Tax=Mycena pura TaxID=153505 RepID=A0AAD6Y6W1_9AGAR|nr:hypothetical protein GGX14DRAFT_467448 [Mycena pura]